MTRCRIMKRRAEFGEKRVDRKGERIITGKEWGRREGKRENNNDSKKILRHSEKFVAFYQHGDPNGTQGRSYETIFMKGLTSRKGFR